MELNGQSIFVLEEENSLSNNFLLEIRHPEIQKDRLRFRRNLERLGETLAYELSKTLAKKDTQVTTSLGTKHTRIIGAVPVLATILRAGLPFHQGFLNYFDSADCAFIGAARGAHKEDHSFDIELGYHSSPSLEGKVLILIDPMLGTGKSFIKAIDVLKAYGTPERIICASVIASRPGAEFLLSQLPSIELFTCALDDSLDENFYIVPGLGDAGDLAFGQKK